MLNEAETVVPAVPITSSGSVMGAGPPDTGGTSMIAALAVLVVSAALVAVTVTVCWLEIVLGAV